MYGYLIHNRRGLSCIGLIAFLSQNSWIIGCIGLLTGGAWFFFPKENLIMIERPDRFSI